MCLFPPCKPFFVLIFRVCKYTYKLLCHYRPFKCSLIHAYEILCVNVLFIGWVDALDFLCFFVNFCVAGCNVFGFGSVLCFFLSVFCV